MLRRAACLLAALSAPLACEGVLKDLAGTKCDEGEKCGTAESGFVCCADGRCRRAGQCPPFVADAGSSIGERDAAPSDAATAVDSGGPSDSGDPGPADAGAADARPSLDAGGTDAGPCLGPRQWDPIGEPSPAPGDYIHAGTDGLQLFVVHHDNSFWRYEPPDGGGASPWVSLARPPSATPVCADNSVSDLAYQKGFFYTSVMPAGGRGVARYEVARDAWEVMGTDAGYSKSSTTGNGMVMDPKLEGVGISVWASGHWWVQFNWNARTTEDNWFEPKSGLGGFLHGHWVSRSDDLATDGSDQYFATKLDPSLKSPSDELIYRWNLLKKGTTVSFFATKPWRAGAGQSLEFIPKSLSRCGHDELWLLRGEDGTSAAKADDGWGVPTATWSRIFVDAPGQGWTQESPLPAPVSKDGELVLVPPFVYVHTIMGWYRTSVP